MPTGGTTSSPSAGLSSSSSTAWIPYKNTKAISVKLDNIDPLTGHENYEDWSLQLTLILNAMGTKEIVVDGRKPLSSASESDQDTFKSLTQSALLVLVQVIHKSILKKVAKYSDPHSIWTYLKLNYYQDNAFSFIHQMNKFYTLSTRFDSSKPISDFIDMFETEWERLYQLTTSNGTNTYRITFRRFLDHNEAKRDTLLAALLPHYPNPVDNLSTKANLTYADLIARLQSLSSNYMRSEQSALIVQRKKGPKRRKLVTNQSTDTPKSPDTCTYCKKHKYRYEGHTWHECRKLKQLQEQRKRDSTTSKAPENAHITLENAKALSGSSNEAHTMVCASTLTI